MLTQLCDKSNSDIWITVLLYKGISEQFMHLYLPKSPVLSTPSHCFLLCFCLTSLCMYLRNLIFPLQVTSICLCGPYATHHIQPFSRWRAVFLSLPLSHACHCSALSATLACFVNNRLFVAGIVATITSDLPVSSIMDKLLDVNICKSLLLNSPPGWD